MKGHKSLEFTKASPKGVIYIYIYIGKWSKKTELATTDNPLEIGLRS